MLFGNFGPRNSEISVKKPNLFLNFGEKECENLAILV